MKALRLYNHDAVIFSADAASAGGHRTLGHIPGSALWGRAAAAFYGQTGSDAFEACHSGRLRFSPGFPVTMTGLPAFPMPQTFQQPKHTAGGLVNSTLTDKVWNNAHPDAIANAGGEPGEAIKNRYLAADGSVVQPKVEDRGKAAIEPGGRRAKTSAYFQYEHIVARQKWIAWIDGPAPLQEAAEKALVGERRRLGRSGLKEFGGGFDIWLADDLDPRAAHWTKTAGKEGRLVLWCLTDVACADAWGTPVFAPTPNQLVEGGFAGQLEPGLSAILTRRYAPYNAHLGAPDREHAVIEAGSVLVYQDVDPALSLGVFREGVGQWRERGLGMVWPNPPMLLELRPASACAGVVAPANWPARDPSRVKLTDEDDAVLRRLRARRAMRADERDIQDKTGKLVRRLEDRLQAAVRRGEPTPGPAQWSHLAAAAEKAEAGEAQLRDELFEEKTGICQGVEWRSMRGFMEQILTGDGGISPKVLARAAWRLRSTWKDGA